jgi:hypothetical protein
VLEFPAVANDDSLVAESLTEKLTFDFVIPEKAENAKVGVEIYTKEAANLLASNASALRVGFELIDATTNTPIRAATLDDIILSEEVISKKSLSLPLTDVRGKTVQLRPMLAGLDLRKVRGALVHEYGAYESGTIPSELPTLSATSKAPDLSVAVHPNPFNPETQIRFFCHPKAW